MNALRLNILVGQEAGDAYTAAAEYLAKGDERDDAGSKYLEASKCYRKCNPERNFRYIYFSFLPLICYQQKL